MVKKVERYVQNIEFVEVELLFIFMCWYASLRAFGRKPRCN